MTKRNQKQEKTEDTTTDFPTEHDDGVSTSGEANDKNDEEHRNANDKIEDLFDLEKLRLSQDFPSMIDVKKVITTVPCHKPGSQEFVRTRIGKDWKIETAIFEDKRGREMYLVDKELHSELTSEIFPACLFTTITRLGDVFLWPVRLPSDEGRSNAWYDSALAAARQAETSWIRVVANMKAGYYDTFRAAGALGEPEWPEVEFKELLRLAFKDRFITTLDHPILRSLRGEI